MYDNIVIVHTRDRAHNNNIIINNILFVHKSSVYYYTYIVENGTPVTGAEHGNYRRTDRLPGRGTPGDTAHDAHAHIVHSRSQSRASHVARSPGRR